MARNTVAGYECTCGEKHEYPLYVYAHWNESLNHTCQKCGWKASILEGVATRAQPDGDAVTLKELTKSDFKV